MVYLRVDWTFNGLLMWLANVLFPVVQGLAV